MKNYINNLIILIGLSITFFYKLKYQRKFIKKTLAVDIAESKKTNDNTLDDQDYKKITDYYGYAVPAILGESYCILRGKKMSLKERYAITYLGGLTGLFDDFFDKKNLPENYIKNLINKPNNLVSKNSNERLFNKFYKKALENSADANLVKSYFFKVLEAQILSKKQICPEIKQDETRRITLLKGGISILFYRSNFSEYMCEEEKMMLYKLGGIGQLENDIFDVYEDYKDGTRTLVTTEKKINNLRETYISLIKDVFELVNKTNYPVKNKKAFLRIVSLVICRGFVCLDKLEKNEKLTDNHFSIENYKRKDLICDMSKPMNFLKAINYYAKYNT